MDFNFKYQINMKNNSFFILLCVLLGFAPAYAQKVTSVLEILDVSSGQRTVVREFPYLIEAPNWTHDGQWLVYNSGGSSFASRPVWRNTSGDYSWRSGSGKKESYSSGGFTTKKASTVSRGGYGRSSSARGHWGG